MDEILTKFETKYHPLQDLDFQLIKQIKIVDRNTIRLLSYNIFLRPPPIKNNEDDFKNERLADFIHRLDEFDIVCLQEMFGSFNLRKQNIIKIAKKMGFFFIVEPPSPSFFSSFMVDGGLLILSRFPIIQSQFLPFRYSVLSDSLSEKGALYAKIKVKDSILHLITTHFQASYFGSSEFNWKLSISTRIDQMKDLSCFITKLIKVNNITTEDTCILCGDFNVDFHHFEKMKKLNKITLESDLDEYEQLLINLNKACLAKDIFKDKFKINPYTFGVNGEDFPKYDRVLIDKEDFGSFQTLDYIFELFIKMKDNNTENEDLKKLKLLTDTAIIEPFLIEDRPYQQLSDHLGLTVELEYQHKK